MLAMKKSKFLKKGLAYLVIVAMVATSFVSMPWVQGQAYATGGESSGGGSAVTTWNPATEKPILVVTGDKLVTDGGVTPGDLTAGIANEKAYTREELEALESVTNTYSAINTSETKSIYKGKGITLDKLFEGSNYTASKYSNANVQVVAKDGYAVLFDKEYKGDSTLKGKPLRTPSLAVERFYYPGIGTDSEVDHVTVPAMLAWEKGGTKGETTPPVETTSLPDDEQPLLLMVGQQKIGEKNNQLFNKTIDKVVAGSELPTILKVGNKDYTRAELLLLDRVTESYTYSTQGGDKTDVARGIPLMNLLAEYKDTDTVEFISADGYKNESVTVGDVRSASHKYMLAYEKGSASDSLQGIYDTAKKDPSVHGYLTVYATGNSPIKMVKEMVVTEATPPLPTKSQYQHISYEKGTPDGNMYNIDAITGATLTVEGPGVVASVPISVGTLEGAKDACLYKGKYTDTRNGVTTERMYEGVRVADILAGTIHDKVKPVDENVTVLFKNRLRQTVATMKLSDIKKAKTPVILAYGTAMPDESNIRPFVYAMANGLDEKLGNGDGCLKVVYDQAAFPNAATSKIFSSVAYIYVEESQPAPGFKHNTAPYDGGENKQYLTTFGGKALGREVNLTTEEIENLVQYDASGNISSSGMGFRKEYGLANTTFWYVNEYEGVKLWDLLKSIGLKDSYKDDDKTKVAFTSWDNYKTAEVFSTKELANPDAFYLYEKAINDLGTSRPPASALIPPTGSQTTTVDAFGYPVQKGYPVLLAYGVNGYPYVKNSGLLGYKSGLGNDGGPMRVVFGKRDYFHNNGSNQLQRVQEIFVGDKVRYSTHQYNDTTNGAYQKIAKDANAALEVEVNLQGGRKQSKTFTVGELEALLYGRDEKGNELSKATIDQRQEKGYYYYKNAKNNAKIQDVFEGVNLWYLLSEAVGMQGQIGTVTFTDANGKTTFLPSLDPLKETGYNSVNGTGDLGAMIAFAKNGYPLVANKNADGYVADDPNGIKGVDGKVKPIKNSDGPLLFIMPQSEAEKEAGTLPEVATVNNVKKISINLEADQYAHTQGAYAGYKDQKVNFTGAVKTTPMAISVEEIEKKQKYMVTDTYTISSSAIEGETLRYRGVELSKFLNSAEVGMSSLAETITVKNTSGDSVQIPILELVNGVGGKKIILAYGSNGDLTTSAGVGLPLVPSITSTGYQSTYKNSGGPLKLIIQSTDGTFSSSKCIENVSEIEVTASKVTGWTHEYGVYASYKDLPALRVSGSDIKTPKTFTVGEIEGLTNLMKQDTYKIGAADADIQGIKLWEFIRDEVGLKEGVTVPSALDFYSPDGYKVSMTGEISRVMNGDVNGKPLLIAYGMNGLPLVAGNDSSDRKPGFDETKGNAFGPLRLVVNDNSGWCAKWLSSIVVGTGSAEKPEADGFRISGDGIESGGKNFTKEGLQSLGEESRDYTYMSGKDAVKDQVKGVSLDRIISSAGIDMAYGYTVNLKTTDGFNGNYKYDGTNKIPTYEHITLGAIKNQNYFVAYEVSGAAISDKDKNNVEANFRIYRNYAATVSGTAIDGSTNWLNCAKNIEGIEIVDPIANQVIFTISAKDFQSPSTYNLSKAYTKKELLAMKATTKSYKYKNQEVSAKGVMLSQLVKDLGIENPNTTITITTTDNYQDTTDGSNLKEIPVGELASKDYLVAYEVDGKTIEDTDKTEAKNTAYVQIYRTMDAGDSGKSANRIKNVNGMKLNPAYNWQTYLKEPNKPAVNEIRNMVAAADGGIWMGTKNGIHYATSQGAITKSYTTANGLPVNWVYDVVPDSKGGLWATQGYDYGNLDNNKGIVYISNTGEITNHTTKNPDGKPPHNFVQALELDSSGNLWIGSFGGLTKFNPATNTWKTYTKEDGLPALSVNVLTKDSKGGLWIGCYPEHTDITTGPFSGGYAYMDPKGVLTKFDADTKGEGLNSGYLADYWVTSIAVGKNDEAWIVRSGAYPYLDNVGGRVDYVSPDKQTVKKYKGKELIPDIEKLKIVTEPATANYYPEIRTVAVDGKGGIWFGTDGIGTYYCSQGKKGDISVIDRFSNSTFDWPLPLIDNVYALTILPNGGVYTGGTGGAAWNVFENLNVENESGGGGKDPEKPEIPSQVDLLIDGDDVEAKVGLTMSEIKEMPSITETYDSLNNFGTRGSSTFTGVPLSDVLKKANLKSSAKSVRMIARDGYYRQFNLDSEALGVYSKDKDGNAMMLAWKEGSKELGGLKLVVGQPNTSYINKELWVDNIVNIRVGNKTVAPGSGTAGAGADKKEEVKSPAQAVINEAKDLVNRIEQMTDAKEIQSVIEEFIKKSEPVVKNEGNEQEKAAMKKAMVEMAQAGLNKIGTVTVSGHGITDENKKQSAVISADLMKDALAKTEKALAEINRTLKENGIFTGKDSLEGMITLQLPKSTGEEVEVTLQADFLESMKSHGLDGIKIQSSAGGILFHLSTLGQEYKGEKIVLKIESVEKDGIHGGIHLPEGSRVVNIRLWVGNQLLTDFGGEKITLSIPFDLGAGKHAQNVAAYFIDNNGRKTKMAGAVYNEKTKTVDTPSSHLSQFAAVYEPLVFTDVKQGAWYYDAVYALANAGWINGKGNGIFAPNDSMTRAEFVQILYKKAGMPTTAATAQFQDVKAGAWYAEAVHWAVKNKVVTGAAGLFRPEENISRQDMAVVLDRFEKNVEKKTLQEKNKQVHFADETQISAYAKEAVSTMQKAGVIQGVGNNRFAPKNNATRGEAAKMLWGLL